MTPAVAAANRPLLRPKRRRGGTGASGLLGCMGRMTRETHGRDLPVVAISPGTMMQTILTVVTSELPVSQTSPCPCPSHTVKVAAQRFGQRGHQRRFGVLHNTASQVGNALCIA